MIGIGVGLVVLAVIFIILGLAVTGVKVLLWVGIGLIVVGAVVALLGNNRRTLP